MIGEVLLAMMLVLAFAPGTPAAHSIHRHLVEAPARWLSRFHRGHVALGLTLTLAAAAIVVLLDLEALRIATMAAPEIATIFTAIDAATLLDMGLAAVAAWSLGGVRRLSRYRPRIVLRKATGSRARRARRSTAQRKRPANDDDGGPAFARAA